MFDFLLEAQEKLPGFLFLWYSHENFWFSLFYGLSGEFLSFLFYGIVMGMVAKIAMSMVAKIVMGMVAKIAMGIFMRIVCPPNNTLKRRSALQETLECIR